MASLLEVRDLRTHFTTRDGVLKAVDGISYDTAEGETVALVGESGSGKTISGLSLLRLMPSPQARIVGGEIRLAGHDLLTLTEARMQRVRGREIAMISQEPMTALNQVLTVGRQIAEPLRLHMGMSDDAARKRAVELLDMVRIPSARQRLDEYPYQFSGGMLQRVMIATALSCRPKVLVADEPTTALDVTIQAQVMELLKEITAELGTAVILITHDLGVVARYANRVNVMYAGRIVESGPAQALYAAPAHPYTRGLLASIPQLDGRRGSRLSTIEGAPPNLLHLPRGCAFQARCMFAADQCREQAPSLAPVEPGHKAACWRAAEVIDHRQEQASASTTEDPVIVASDRETIVDVRHLHMHFPVKRGLIFKRQVASVHAVDDVSFAIRRGETLGLVGESGSGKTTVGRSLLKLSEATAGDIYFQGINLRRKTRRTMKPLRRDMQLVFQDPYGSLNARMTVGQIIGEPLWLHDMVRNRKETRVRVAEILETVGLDPAMRARFPHELSGGQRQRIGIARALAVEPDLIVADEPVSALDVSVQAQIINLMEDIQDRLGIAFLFISHDLAVVRHISDRVAVMYLGRIMETANCETLYSSPRHPYTESLLAAVPVADPIRERQRNPQVLKGEIPSPVNPPSGCVFRTRCPLATEECRQHIPPLREVGPGHWVACIYR